MLVSLNEIKKYVNLDGITPDEIAKKITSAGIEVDSYKPLANATNLVIGHIIQCDKHPESDHLHVNKVDIGSDVLNIVCGAPNCRNGLKVIVAKVGAQLPEKKIEKSIIRGQESQGMLCALNEIGVDPKNLRPEQISGIEELPADAPIGETNVLGYLGLDDVIFDLELLPNRSDAYSLYNVAREIGALFGRDVNIPKYISSNLVDYKYKVSSFTDKCKFFSVRVFKGVKIGPSPKWLSDVLRNEGIRSINNIVDIGNYAMLLTGQPINMYDADKLPKEELVVKDDFEGDLLAMDDKKYAIKKGDLVVTSDNKPVCLAGIMTTKEAEVTESSKNIVVESAIFYGAQIRRTSIRLGLTSDSAQRFIKGLNPNQNEDVLNLIENLMKNIANYDECSKTILYDVQNYKDKEIPCTFSYINNRLGTNFPNDVIVNTLSKLYFKIKNVTKDGFVAVVPSFRIDVDGKADLSEEILRFNGFDSINSILPYMETTVGGRNSNSKKEKIIADYLLERGLYRIVTYNLLSKEDIGTFNLLNKNEGYVIMNPITEDHKFIRTNLLSSIVRTIQYNLNHQNKNFGVFEIAQIDDKKEVSIHLSLGLCGNKFSQDMMGAQAYSFYDAKGILESILTMFNIQSTRVKYDRIVDSKELHPNRSCKVTLDGKLLAVIGDIYPTLKDKYDMKKEAVVLLEMNLSLLFNTRTGDDHYVELNKFPSVSRDYAFIFDKSTKYADVKNEIKKLSTLISDVHIFDIYEGEHLVKDKVSIAMNVTFEAKDHTLKDEEVNSVDGKIKSLLLSKFNAIMRI